MATGWPMKTTYANGDVYSASDVNDITGTINLLTSTTLSQAAAKNFVINGGTDIWQRGTSFSGAGVYSADRWYTGVGNTTYARESSVLPTGFQYAMRMTTTATATAPTIWQAIETNNAVLLQGKIVTLSYYARSSDAVNALIRLDSSTTTDTSITGSWTNIAVFNSATTSTGYTRVSAQFTVPSNALSLRIIIGANSNLSNGGIFYITGVQLELGSTATTFSRAGGTIQGELAACQRYYWRQTVSTSNGVIANGWSNTTSNARIGIYLPNPMRIAPTSVDFPTASTLQVSDLVSGFQLNSVGLDGNTSNNFATINCSISGTSLTVYRPYQLAAFASSTAFIGLSAEL